MPLNKETNQLIQTPDKYGLSNVKLNEWIKLWKISIHSQQESSARIVLII